MKKPRLSMRALDAQQELIAVQMYLANKTLDDLAVHFGVSRNGVRAAILRQGIQLRSVRQTRDIVVANGPRPRNERKPKVFLSDAEKEQMLAEYQAGLSAQVVANNHGVDRIVVTTAMKKAGVELRSKSESHRLPITNEGAFADAENDPVAAYFCGLLMADGAIGEQESGSGTVHLGLTKKDIGMMESFKSFVGCSHKIGITKAKRFGEQYTGKPMHQMGMTSPRMAADLAKYGIIRRKSHTSEVRLLEMNPHFWRGLCDGDGTLWVVRQAKYKASYAALDMLGSKPIMEQFLRFLKSICPGCRATVRPTKGIWRVRTAGTFALEMILRMYYLAPMSLQRKQRIAEFLWQNCSKIGRLHDWKALYPGHRPPKNAQVIPGATLLLST